MERCPVCELIAADLANAIIAMHSRGASGSSDGVDPFFEVARATRYVAAHVGQCTAGRSRVADIIEDEYVRKS